MRTRDTREVLAAIDRAAAEIESARVALGESTHASDQEEIASLARRFCQLDNDAQARFFTEVARTMAAWPPSTYGCALDSQAHFIGRHLRTCECSTDDARALVRGIYYGMEPRGMEPRP